MRIKLILAASLLLVVPIGFAAACEEGTEKPVVGLPLTGQQAAEFLRSAKIVGTPEPFDPVAITSPLRVTLTDGVRTLRAIFKDEHTVYPEFRFGDGREFTRVQDSYKHEIAAFQLDLLLDLGVVPPCVERKIDSRTGSLCLWIESSRPEDERREKGLTPPDPEKFINDVREIRLFQQLIADLDYSNIRNVVVDDNFKVYKVDSSMAFYPDPQLFRELDSSHMSRRFLDALRSLERKPLDQMVGPWLKKPELKDLVKRRERILQRADRLIAEHGEDEVLY